MKLIVQIPCYNEVETLGRVLGDLPDSLAGVDEIETIVIDDGSSDGTSRLAREFGAVVIRHNRNRGLAAAFASGLAASLARDADIIVNTDGDHQYRGADIARLISPILSGDADLVVGDRRPTSDLRLSWMKRQLHRLGRLVVSRLAGEPIADPVSGFRAYNRHAAARMHIVTSYTYTIETILQAAHKGLAIQFVPIATNGVTRPSRLFRSMPQFVLQSAVTLLRVFFMFYPLYVLVACSAVLATIGVMPIVRFLVFYIEGDGDGHVQSLVLGSALVLLSGLLLIAGLLADLISHNRRMLEKVIETRNDQNDRRRQGGGTK